MDGRGCAASATACRLLCKKPFVQGIESYGCGQCQPCRINRRRLWTHRLLLEARLHEFSSFWTLTYDEDHFPADGSLRPKHTQDWLKRLRKHLGPTRPIRYYLVGEYGDETWRPHYHAALFGVSRFESDSVSCTWGLGFSYGGDLTPESAQYIAGYVTKKMTSHEDPRLGNRYPEFARMSLRPGIGAGATQHIADALNDTQGAAAIGRDGDVPASLLHGRSRLPLGRYLRRRLRGDLGFDTIGGQESQKVKKVLEVRSHEGGTSGYFAANPIIDQVRIRQVEGKARIWAKKGKL